MTITHNTPENLAVADEILTDEALTFVEALHEKFGDRREELLGARETEREKVVARGSLDFPQETRQVREGEWKVAPAPEALRDRRVEMTGPASPPNMAINALNSGAKVWLADLEDAASPSWYNQIDSVANLRDAARGTLRFTSSKGKEYTLREDRPRAVVVVRPRGWHLPEKNITVNGKTGSGSLTDFGLHFFHTAQQLLENGHGPYYYLPKMESYLEARLWEDVFTFAEEYLGLDHGTIRATVLIETIPAAFQMDEILYELRDHASGLNAGRWDYLFSIIKYFRDAGEKFILADRSSVTMTAPLMRAYTDLLVQTCHKRGAFAMGGMAAFIPSRKDEEVNRAAFEKVRNDKSREAQDGFDGSWVAHPDLVPVCQEVFDDVLGDKPNQVDRLRPDVTVTAEQLLDVPSAGDQRTEAELNDNLYVAIRYIAVWLSGNGAVAIHNLMEDAATAEISRSQVWQQIKNGVVYQDTGNTATQALVSTALDRQLDVLRGEIDSENYEKWFVPAGKLIQDMVLREDYPDFLTLPAYELMEGIK
ncbi:malate synthase A [Rothia uropygialis]|uniref:malate synthase A n=1 Tax=Kocuria sp. 36 TaxID=1415402 RepID=UPI00101B644D|nr:malate synthase A [Kocuria sp. 36]